MAKVYPQHKVEEALIAAATLGIRPAAQQLDIPKSTIHKWTQEQPDRWATIRAQEAPKWRERAAASFEDVVDSLTALERKAMQRLEDQLAELDPKDTAAALRNISTSKGINSTHVQSIRGEPAQVIEHRWDVNQLDRAMQTLLETQTVDSTAVEDAEPQADRTDGDEPTRTQAAQLTGPDTPTA